MGEHDQSEHLTLAEAQASHGVYAQVHDPRDEVSGITVPGTSTDTTRENESASTTVITNVSSLSPAGPTQLRSERTPILQRAGPGIRLYASESRMWHAIAGHEPDYNRVKKLDFICLSIIAACGPKGIPQHDLVRISGQDKRSLPTRTDRLHKDGYIIKRPVSLLVDGTRLMHTSLCTLKRFAEASKATATKLSAAAKEALSGRKRKTTNLNVRTGVLSHEESQEAEETSVRATPTVADDTQEETASSADPGKEPHWTPDRSLVNQIFDVVDQSGSEGVTLSEISANLFGPDYKKPIEDLVAKLVNSWQISQPLHLRHLAIVRDTVQRGKAPVYIHYSFANFKTLVGSGDKVWEAVLTLPDGGKKGKVTIPQVGEQPKLDEYGFPKLDPNQFQGRHNEASLFECVPGSGIAIGQDHVKERGNSSVYKTAERSLAIPSNASRGIITDSRKNLTTTVLKGRGRPRKYQTTGIPNDIMSWDPDDIRALVESRRTAEKYQKNKIVDELKRRRANGEDPVTVTHEILEETDRLRKEQGKEPMSNFLVTEILHEHAGGREPTAEEDQVGRLRKMIKYTHHLPKYPQGKWPRQGRPPASSSATRNPFPSSEHEDSHFPPVISQQHPTGFETIGSRTRRRRDPVPVQRPIVHATPIKHPKEKEPRKETIPFWFLPSVAAHSQPHHHIPLQHAVIWPGSEMKKKGRPPKRPLEEVEVPRYLPSIAAHSRILPLTTRAPLNASTASEMPPPKKQKITQNLDYDAAVAYANASVTPIFAAHGMSQTATPQHRAGRLNPAVVRMLMSGKYEDAEKSIARPRDGVFIGQTAQRYKRRDDPVAMTSRKYQLAIFKLASLKDLDWFVEDQPIANWADLLPSPSPEQTGTTQDPGNFVIKLPALKNMAWFVENRPSTQSEKLYVRPSQGQMMEPPQPQENRARLVSDDEETEDDMVTAPSSPIPIAPWRLKQSKSSVTSRPSTATGPRPSFATSHIAWKQPRVGTFAHKGPLPQAYVPPSIPKYSGRARTNGTARIRLNETSRAQTSQSLTASAGNLHESGSPHATAGILAPESSSDPQVYLLEIGKNRSRDTPAEATNPQEKETVDNEPGSSSPSKPPEISSSDGISQSQAVSFEVTNVRIVRGDVEPDPALVYSDKASPAVDPVPASAINTPDAAGERTRGEVLLEPVPVAAINTLEASGEQTGGEYTEPEAAPKPFTGAMTKVNPISTPVINIIPSNVTYYTKPTAEEQRKAIVNPLPTPHKRKTATKINLTGGSTAILRREIIMDLLHKCEGVFPGVTAMRTPFVSQWKARGQSGDPDRATVARAVDLICESGKLRKLGFAFRNYYGRNETTSILALPEVDPHDQKVKDMQAKIKHRSPLSYVPAVVMPTDDLDSRVVKRQEIQRYAVEKKARVDEAKAMAFKSSEERAAYMMALKSSDRGEQEVDPLAKYAEPSTANVKRLGMIKGPSFARPRTEALPPPIKAQAKVSASQRSLTWLPQKLAFSEENFDTGLPTLFPSKEQLDESHTRPGTRDLADNRAWIERNQAGYQAERPSLLYSDSNPESQYASLGMAYQVSLPSPAFAEAPPMPPSAHQNYSPVLGPTRTSSNSVSPTPTLQTPPGLRRRKRKRVEDKDVIFPGFMDPVHHFHIATGTFYASFAGFRLGETFKKRNKGINKSYNRAPDPPVGWKSPFPPRTVAKKASSPARKAEAKPIIFPGLSTPDVLHPATGTFAGEFLGFHVTLVMTSPRRIRNTQWTKFTGPSAKEMQWLSPSSSPNTDTFFLPPQSSDRGTFETEIDRMLDRELDTEGVEDVRYQGWPIVSHSFPHAHLTVANTTVDFGSAKYVAFKSKDGRGVNKDIDSARAAKNTGTLYKHIKPRVAQKGMAQRKSELNRANISPDIFSQGARTPRTTNERGSTIIQNTNGYQSGFKRRRIDSLADSSAPGRTSEPTPEQKPNKHFKLRRIRGPQKSKTLGANGELRLYTAVLVVRILTGGISQRIDWNLVAKVFLPELDQAFIRTKWSAVLNKLRNHVDKMDANFQTLFAKAYEEGTVPQIDFDHLEDYDWKWLVDWTIAKQETPKNFSPELPADRNIFDKQYTVKDASFEEDLGHFYEFEGHAVSHLRRAVINRHAYVCHLSPKHSIPRPSQTPSEEEQIGIARTWIRANILTPTRTYNSQAARAKLLTLPEPTIDAALKSLVQDRSIIEGHRGRIIPGRNYVISDYFYKRLGRNIPPEQFHRAVAFKLHLDQAFEEAGSARWTYTADDGDSMAVLNLVATRRVKLFAVNPPLDKWGQTDGGYETRQMDKNRLNFEVDIVPTPTYVPGKPLEPLLVPPAPHLLAAAGSINPSNGQRRRVNIVGVGKEMNRIPLWYDINNDPVPHIWRPVLAAVLGLLAVRPGASAVELQINLRPVLELWEVEEVLKWMVKGKIVEWTGQGRCVVNEWWWMALGEVPELEVDEDGYAEEDETRQKVPKKRAPNLKNKGKGKERAVSFSGLEAQGADVMMID